MEYLKSIKPILNKIVVFGTNHSNTLGLVRSLGEKKLEVHCVLFGTEPNGLVYYSKYPKSVIMFSTLEECKDYIINTFSNEQLKPIMLSSSDIVSSYIDMNSEVFSKNFYIENAGKKGYHTSLMNKFVISELAKNVGLKVPKMLVLEGNKLDSIDLVEYPCFTKDLASINGGKKNECVCSNKQDLLNFLRTHDYKSLLIQKYINKKTEFCLQGFSANGQIYIPYVMTYLRFSDDAFGGFVRMDRFDDEKLKIKCEELIRTCNYTGLFSIEFIIDTNGIYYFTEVNLRNDGYSYFSTSGGANLPYLYCYNIINGSVDVENLILKNTYLAMNEGYDYKQSVLSGKISKLEYFKDFLRSKSHIVFNIKDLSFLVKTALRKVNLLKYEC